VIVQDGNGLMAAGWVACENENRRLVVALSVSAALPFPGSGPTMR